MHFELVWRGEERAAYGVLANRVGNRTFFQDQITQILLRRGIRSGQAGWTGADDYQIEWFAHKIGFEFRVSSSGLLWSAVTCHRFGRSCLVATTVRLNLLSEFGAR